MLTTNPLVRMMTLLSATPHLTLWAVESNQKLNKKVSAPMFCMENDGIGPYLKKSKEQWNILVHIIKNIKCTLQVSFSNDRDAYKTSIDTMSQIFELANNLQISVNYETFKNEKTREKSEMRKEEYGKIKEFSDLLNVGICNFNTNDLSNADKEMGKQISELFEKFKEITGNPGKKENVLIIPNKLSQIRDHLIKDKPKEYKNDADFVLCTDQLRFYILKFKLKMGELIKRIEKIEKIEKYKGLSVEDMPRLLLEEINKIGKIPGHSKQPKAYDRGIYAIIKLSSLSHYFELGIKNSKSEVIVEVKKLSHVLTENIKNFKEYVLNDMQKVFEGIEPQHEVPAFNCVKDEVEHLEISKLFKKSAEIDQSTIEGTNLENIMKEVRDSQCPEDEIEYGKIRELARDCVKIDQNTAEGQHFKDLLTKLINIREYLIKKYPENYAQYKSFKLVTEKLWLYSQSFKNIMNNWAEKSKK